MFSEMLFTELSYGIKYFRDVTKEFGIQISIFPRSSLANIVI